MSRYIRLLAKKRGKRLAGSKQAGGLAMILFFAGLVFMGGVLLVLIVRELVIPQWRASQTYRLVQASIAGLDVQTRVAAETPQFRPRLRMRYEVDERTHEPWVWSGGDWTTERAEAERALTPFAVGQVHECWYDPLNPDDAVLERGVTWFPWLMLLMPAAFISVGVSGVWRAWQWGKSAERMAVRRRRPRPRSGAPREFPTVPNPASLSDSPGTTLAFRLPVAAQALWRLAAIFAACVAANGVGFVFLGMALRLHRLGAADWWLSLFALSWVAAGVACVWWFVRQLYITTGVRPTIVEISDHPLYAGEEYELYYAQAGGLVVHTVRITLVCEEKATYRQGTDTRTERRRVFSDELFLREGFRIREGDTFSIRCKLRLPATAMHSFKAACNEVNWSLLVEGEVGGEPEYIRAFPVVVFPRRGEAAPR